MLRSFLFQSSEQNNVEELEPKQRHQDEIMMIGAEPPDAISVNSFTPPPERKCLCSLHKAHNDWHFQTHSSGSWATRYCLAIIAKVMRLEQNGLEKETFLSSPARARMHAAETTPKQASMKFK
ncbi:hypothetical protein Ciccas_011671, partial [Cichlidogyrus casuarinus]